MSSSSGSRPLFARIAAVVCLFAAVHSVVLTSALPAFAQARPAQDLVTRGRNLFDDQQYEESIQTLSAALLRPNNTIDQKVEIYRLLALNYITLNRKDESESAVRGLLALNPEYKLPSSESPRFRDFFAATQKKWEDEGRPGLVKATEPPPAAVGMAHSSPSQVDRNTDIPLSIKLDDPQGRVYGVKLFYRGGSKGKFISIDAILGGGTAKATIPKTVVQPPLVEYYFEGYDKGNLPIVSRGDAAAPLRVAVPEPSKAWIIPVAIGGGVVVIGATLVILAVAGVFSGGAAGKSTVSISINE